MTKKPNIIFILTDDQGWWSLGCTGCADAITPNLDALAGEGMLFENFFCVSPVCSPARASIFTGRIPSQHGIHDWLDEAENQYLKDQSNFVEQLSNNGYHCCHSGKWHLGASDQKQMGFHRWYAHKYGGGPYYNAPVFKEDHWETEPAYFTDAVTDFGLEFLQNHDFEAPFYLQLHYTAPHSPWNAENHPKELLDLFQDCTFNSCPQEPLHPWRINVMPDGKDPKERHSILSGYFASLVSVDQNIHRVVEYLKKIGEYENTVFVYTSDNGMNMGHHGFYGKGNGTSPQNMYDTSVKVPFFITHPNHIASGHAESLYSHYDLRPTILEYVGIKDITPEVPLPGKSFAPVLTHQVPEEDNAIVVYNEYGPCRMIRTKQWKYVHRYPDGPYELYDLVNDPQERNNLYGNQQYEERVRNMRQQLAEWFVRFVNPQIDGATLPVYGGGQRGWAGLWGDGSNVFDRYTSPFIFSSDGLLQEKRSQTQGKKI